MTSGPRGTSTANRASASGAPHRRRPPRSVGSMDRGESGVDRQICNQPLDLPPAREVDVVAKRAILLGAPRGGEAGLLAMVADPRLCIVDRGAVGQQGCWPLPAFPARLHEPPSYLSRLPPAFPRPEKTPVGE